MDKILLDMMNDAITRFGKDGIEFLVRFRGATPDILVSTSDTDIALYEFKNGDIIVHTYYD